MFAAKHSYPRITKTLQSSSGEQAFVVVVVAVNGCQLQLHPRSSGGAFQNGGGVLPAHHSEDVQQIGNGARFAVTRLPQVENVIRRAVFRGKVIDVPVRCLFRKKQTNKKGGCYFDGAAMSPPTFVSPVDAQSLGQHSPVVAPGVGRIEQLTQLAAHRHRKPEGSSFGIERRQCSVAGCASIAADSKRAQCSRQTRTGRHFLQMQIQISFN